jgi:GntR family phosphonate transport system transcriptional regulator
MDKSQHLSIHLHMAMVRSSGPRRKAPTREFFVTDQSLAPGVERGSGVALWRQIEETLEKEIARGSYRSDVAFPTEAALTRRFQVNRHTVRRAVGSLARRGLLRVEQGRGAFLAEHAVEYALGPRTRFSENLLRQGRQPGRSFIRMLEVPASPEIATALALRSGAPTLFLETIGSADGRPISLGVVYFPLARLPGIAAALSAHGTISDALAAVGVVDYRRKTTRVTARPPTETERSQLRLPPGRPLLVTESVDVDGAGRPILFGRTGFAADRVQLTLDT